MFQASDYELPDLPGKAHDFAGEERRREVRDTPIRLLCIAILLVFAGAWLSTLSGGLAGANRPLVNGLNTTPILETNRGVSVEEYREDKPPILNPGKPSLPCAECKDWSGQWEGNRFVVRRNGRDVTREVVGSEAEMFSRTPLKGRL